MVWTVITEKLKVMWPAQFRIKSIVMEQGQRQGQGQEYKLESELEYE